MTPPTYLQRRHATLTRRYDTALALVWGVVALMLPIAVAVR